MNFFFFNFIMTSDERKVSDVVEIEEYGRKNQKPPKAKKYIIRIDREKYELTVHSITGRQILEIAGKEPPEHFMVSQRLHGGVVKSIGLDEYVDVTEKGVERFMTLPLDQTNG